MTINELCYYKYAEPWGEDADEVFWLQEESTIWRAEGKPTPQNEITRLLFV